MNRKNVVVGSAVAIVAVMLFAVLLASGGIMASQTVNASGTISSSANLGVYSDPACTQSLTSISWGTLSPGSSVFKTIYIANTGTVSMILSLSDVNWNPSFANGPITLVWDKEGASVAPYGVVVANFMLHVSSSISGVSSFSVDLVISGTS